MRAIAVITATTAAVHLAITREAIVHQAALQAAAEAAVVPPTLIKETAKKI